MIERFTLNECEISTSSVLIFMGLSWVRLNLLEQVLALGYVKIFACLFTRVLYFLILILLKQIFWV